MSTLPSRVVEEFRRQSKADYAYGRATRKRIKHCRYPEDAIANHLIRYESKRENGWRGATPPLITQTRYVSESVSLVASFREMEEFVRRAGGKVADRRPNFKTLIVSVKRESVSKICRWVETHGYLVDMPTDSSVGNLQRIEIYPR